MAAARERMPSANETKIQFGSSSATAAATLSSLRCRETEPSSAGATEPNWAPLLALRAPQQTSANRAGAVLKSCKDSTCSHRCPGSLQAAERRQSRNQLTARRRATQSTYSDRTRLAFGQSNTLSATRIILIGCLLLLIHLNDNLRLTTTNLADAKSIKDSTEDYDLLAADLCVLHDCDESPEQQHHKSTTTPRPTVQTTESPGYTLSALLEKITYALGGGFAPASTTPIPRLAKLQQDTSATTTTDEEGAENGSTGAGNDDCDSAGCEGVSDDGSAKAKNLTDHERLVHIQTYLQGKIKQRMKSSTLAGMRMFEELQLSGGCSSSLMSLAGGLTDLKAYAFKFLDATAKIPSGFMYGLLSDFGDFDQCLSIRADPSVAPEHEEEEGTYSGKYCLLNVRMSYHIELKPNETVPEGIDPYGILWDELLRNYWTSNSTKGFQLGVCVPSRCSHSDLEQIFHYVADQYNIRGELFSCQDSNDIRRQLTPDLLQLVIIYTFVTLFSLSILGALIERYFLELILERSSSLKAQISSSSSSAAAAAKLSDSDDSMANEDGLASSKRCAGSDLLVTLCQEGKLKTILNVLVCFSLRRNWHIFINKQNSSQDLLNSNQWLSRESYRSGAGGSFTNRVDDRSQAASKTLNWQQPLTQLTTANTISMNESGVILPAYQSSTTLASSHRAAKSMDSLNTATNIPYKTTLASPRADQLGSSKYSQQLMVKIQQPTDYGIQQHSNLVQTGLTSALSRQESSAAGDGGTIIGHLSGLKLIVIFWITIGHSFLYPSANNYQYYRSIINMNVTRDSVWFATTNFTLGIDMLLYMSGLLFVYKLARLRTRSTPSLLSSLLIGGPDSREAKSAASKPRSYQEFGFLDVLQMIARKVLHFWPTYLSVIALAIVIPLVSDGPLWPEMVQRRLGDTCRRNFWANLLIVNNMFFSESEICLPSSWFVSVLMQLFLIGALIVLLARQVSLRLACLASVLLLVCSSAASFALAYYSNLSAPVIRMDQSFVLELDDRIFKMYTNLFNNMGPFIIGLMGGMLLLRYETYLRRQRYQKSRRSSPKAANADTPVSAASKCWTFLCELILAISVATVATCVLSSVFFQNYTRFWAAFYWAFHRIGWAIVTGYVIHQCATGRWKLLYDLLSLSAFIPLSKLVFIAYLVYPIYIHVHSGFVRDGLHVSIYNMLNIYVTRLVLTFSTALGIHLFVELPFCSIEHIFLHNWVLKLTKQRKKLVDMNNPERCDMKRVESTSSSELSSLGEDTKPSKFHPLLTVVESQMSLKTEDVVGFDQTIEDEKH